LSRAPGFWVSANYGNFLPCYFCFCFSCTFNSLLCSSFLTEVLSLSFCFYSSNASGSKEASTQAGASQSGGATSGQDAAAGASGGAAGPGTSRSTSTRKPTPHDRYADLQKHLLSDEYSHVIVDNAPDVSRDNPTLAEMLHRKAR